MILLLGIYNKTSVIKKNIFSITYFVLIDSNYFQKIFIPIYVIQYLILKILSNF